MKIPKVENCCCCFSPRAGTLIIAILSMLGPIIIMPVMASMKVEKDNPQKDYIEAMKITIYVLGGISLIISLFLLVGTIMRKTILMMPWVALAVVGIIINIIMTLYNTIALLVAGVVGVALMGFAISTAFILIHVYFWLVVYTHFRELREDSLNTRMGV